MHFQTWCKELKLFAPLPLKKFHMENLRSSRSSFPLPSSRKTLEMARGSCYKLETLGTVEYESCIAPIQDRNDSSSVPNPGIGITKAAGICTNGGRHKLDSLNNLCNSGRHCKMRDEELKPILNLSHVDSPEL